ncbi:N-acetylglucosaminyl-phosphatidylinositol de-N-acetylase [Uranotaenia lowii]|uniref:N-acetylglucosaminyl-phosphatidylinositol de-N-acetylase n=1 Tax=Uranotaenia lowii TaxID=190385 RepID=UPI00247AF694|nr:N-acetylglucosaminyl-phosphatidylinositol de-N-acetylase [Uranotaenia lowii]
MNENVSFLELDQSSGSGGSGVLEEELETVAEQILYPQEQHSPEEDRSLSIAVQFIINYLVLCFRETLDHIVLVILIYTLLCLVLYKLLFHRCSRWLKLFRKSHFPANVRRALLVTAHPDDECMFFGPTILELRRLNCRVFLLCLSEGNFASKGEVRRQELWDACLSLGIKAEDITLLRATHLQDDPAQEWKTVTIANQVLKHLEALDADLLITFDKDGVSGHPNHCAIYYATASLCLSGMIPSKCKVLTLESINLCRKYASLLDLPITLLLSTNWAVLNWESRKAVQNAMALHRSQLVWFRKLYIIFSRYMVINSLCEINQSDVEFEILGS